MIYYIDIPVSDGPAGMNSVFLKVHLGLVRCESTAIGVSFPNKSDQNMGDILRLHGTQNDLVMFTRAKPLGNYKFHILQIPSECSTFVQLVVFKPQKGMSKLNRMIKRGTIAADEVKQYKRKMLQDRGTGPYLLVYSSSSKQMRKTFIDCVSHSTPIPGIFDRFGFSKSATIPSF